MWSENLIYMIYEPRGIFFQVSVMQVFANKSLAYSFSDIAEEAWKTCGFSNPVIYMYNADWQ